MAMKLACDAFGTVRDVRKYRLLLIEPQGGGKEKLIKVWEPALCLRGLVRLMRMIERGVGPTRKEEVTDDEQK